MKGKKTQGGIRILIADDDPSLRELIREEGLEHGYSVVTSPAGEKAVEACRRDVFDVIIAGARFGPDESGVALLHACRVVQPEAEIIITTAESAAGFAPDAWRAGAFHQIAKPFAVDDLLVHIGRALAYRQLKRENRVLRRQVDEQAQRSHLVGHTPAMLEVQKRIAACADSRLPVLIWGEAGTGKDLIARIIHYSGARRDQQFVKIDCTLPEAVLEADMLGFAGGESTAGLGNRRGMLEEASGGTVLLDEIAALPLRLQSKLLRTLETQRVQRPGNKDSIPVDIRFVSADRGGLAERVQGGRFREGLYERLRTFEINLPRLRDRSADVPELIEHFLKKLEQERGRSYRVSHQAALMLLAYAWPGNVRELENALKWAAGHSRSGLLGPGEFPPEVQAGFLPPTRLDDLQAGLPSLQDLGRRYLADVLRLTRGNKSAAAAILGISRKTLYRMQRTACSRKRRLTKNRDA